ncbi:MAG: pyruvate dehydrogenase (acetyl-transferring) E1 component subunit alpha [Acholeplasmataceae bacterium]|nr:pyruvate dehydrogenase (acetyl-transferring) E1 component subunit alpha [Acholeplasmataceae bacterium]
MLFKDYDPLKKKRLSILDEKGKIVNKDLEPDIDKDTLLKMYKTMALGRIADTKALQYQRQGRMLTYAPNKGQEAAQVGAAAAMQEQDWFVPAFRELNAMLYRGVTLEQMYLYWYGNEWGSHFDEGVKVLPINIIIGSQINHASGVAYASKILKKNEVAVASIGDGGTSHGEFYEGLNFASSFDLPLVVMIQNNQYAISTPRKKATKAETLAQKAVAFGIPGMQVDGNDVLAMYVAMQESIEYARSGKGPVLIEAYTYRLGPHTTSDDPTLYREDSEVAMWEKRDPMIRFKKYLIDKGYWSEKEDKALEEEQTIFVGETFKKVEQSGTAELLDVFKYTYEEMTPQLTEQYETHKKFLEEGGK